MMGRRLAMRLNNRAPSSVASVDGRFAGIAKIISISVINQVVSSGTNFALALYLVRALTTTEFGLYSIGFSIAQLYSGVGDALVLTQMVVHMPDKPLRDQIPYASRMLVALALFCVATIAAAEAFLVISGRLAPVVPQYLDLIAPVVAAAIGFLLKSFFVRHAYTARNESSAVLINASVAAALVCMLSIEAQSGNVFNSASALWVYAFSNMVGAFVGLAIARLPIFAVGIRQIFLDMNEAWAGGRWALAGVGVTWSQTQAYMYVTALYIGPAGVGLANAARILITPAMFLMPAITQLVMPRLASMRAANMSEMISATMRFSRVAVVLAILYSLTLVCLRGLFVRLLIGKYSYEAVAPLVAPWCLLLIFQFSRVGTVICLQVIKEFRLVTLLNAVSLVIAISGAIVLMNVLGVRGAILGSAVGELIFSVLLYSVIRARFTHSQSKVSSP
jgi:O-antigen/teichoic acid export membrane protein